MTVSHTPIKPYNFGHVEIFTINKVTLPIRTTPSGRWARLFSKDTPVFFQELSKYFCEGCVLYGEVDFYAPHFTPIYVE